MAENDTMAAEQDRIPTDASADWRLITDALDALERTGAIDRLSAEQLGAVYGRVVSIQRQVADRQLVVNEHMGELLAAQREFQAAIQQAAALDAELADVPRSAEAEAALGELTEIIGEMDAAVARLTAGTKAD